MRRGVANNLRLYVRISIDNLGRLRPSCVRRPSALSPLFFIDHRQPSYCAKSLALSRSVVRFAPLYMPCRRSPTSTAYISGLGSTRRGPGESQTTEAHAAQHRQQHTRILQGNKQEQQQRPLRPVEQLVPSPHLHAARFLPSCLHRHCPSVYRTR